MSNGPDIPNDKIYICALIDDFLAIANCRTDLTEKEQAMVSRAKEIQLLMAEKGANK